MTIQFQTEIQDDTIKLPENVQRCVGKGKRVTVTITEESNTPPKRQSRLRELMANPVRVENFVPMTRDEIYERDE